ncbi:LuxR C-terminal-related transcriptional regulator [Nocardia sp. CDC153]|uniref:helix-turn-helix transcriptional regulator n=1 Tax=Nocardia sp. CDC153 TaxID=3112167 RepID=UPI002DBB0BEC|nr:LuxR C-terminal-related transcriptional regulator [Nocardia sp. CDC153]MEC3953520.1 LuxR C-terminal-related transcriptional regulator [Nocardia sp. CDC153]
MRCSAEAERLRVARAVAVLGEAAEVGRVAALLDADLDEIRTLVAELASAGLIVGQCRPHPDMAAAVLRELPDHERRLLHVGAAELLCRAGFPANAVARHLVEAGDARGSWAAQVLVEVADNAYEADELDSAGTHLELAYRASRRADERAAIATRLVAVEWRINPSSRTRNFGRLKAALRTGRVPYADLPMTVLHMLWHGYVLHADHALVRLRRDADGAGALADRLAFLGAWLRYTHPVQAQRNTWLALDRFGRDSTPPERDSPHRQAAVLLTALRQERPGAEIAAAAQRILAQHRLTPATVEVLVAAVDCLLYTDRLDAADAWCASLLAEATARRAPTWQALFASARAETLLRKGNLVEAAGHALIALNLLPAEQLGVWVGRPVAVLVRALTAQGRHAEAAAQLERPVPRAMFESRFALGYLRAHGEHCVATGRPEEALRHFRRCGRLMDEWGMDFAGFAPWRNDLAVASLATGQQWQAQNFAMRHLDAIGGAERHHSGGVSLRVLAATSDPLRRVTLLRRAAALARAGGDELELARVLADLGDAYRGLGEADRARPPLREAARLAESCGCEPLLARLRADAGADGTPREVPGAGGGEALSPAERRVAELAALGNRNRDIAEELCITTSTVEQHLTRVYRKLAVARRGELRFALAAYTQAKSSHPEVSARTAVG